MCVHVRLCKQALPCLGLRSQFRMCVHTCSSVCACVLALIGIYFLFWTEALIVLSPLLQDMCVVCGSFGQGAEGRLLACAQCGQCYHPFCVNIKVMRSHPALAAGSHNKQPISTQRHPSVALPTAARVFTAATADKRSPGSHAL